MNGSHNPSPEARYILDVDRSWQEGAPCQYLEPEFFFPVRGDGSADNSAEATAPAKEVCHTCPVEATCLEFALVHREQGVWGGTDDAERERMRKGA